MGYWDAIEWDAIRKDIEKGIKEGLVVMKKGAAVAQKKAGELTEEGIRRYKVLELKTKIQKKLYDLGGRVYAVMGTSARPKNPAADAQVQDIVCEIGDLEGRIAALEGTSGGRTPGKARKKKTAKKRG